MGFDMRKLLLTAASAAFLLTAGAASAATVALQNSDFSQGLAQADGEFSAGHTGGNPTGWGASGGSSTGHWNPTTASFQNEAAHGGVGWTRGNGISTNTNGGMLAQTVANYTIQANTRYTLTLDVGRRLDGTGSWNYAVGLMAGAFNTPTADIFASLIGDTDKSGVVIPAGAFKSISLVFETGANNPFIGKQLSILLSGDGYVGTAFDNVYLDATPLTVSAVPEPATWAMMISGFGLAGASLRRRRGALAVA